MSHRLADFEAVPDLTQRKERMKVKKHILMTSIASLALIALFGCGQKQAEQGSTTDTTTVAQAPPQTAPTTDQAPPPQVVEEPAPKAPATKPPATKPQPKPEPKPEPRPESPKMVTIPTGTSIVVALETHLRTDSNQVGDVFRARTTEAVRAEDMTVIPVGAEVRGRLTQVEEPHRTSGKAQMTLSFEEYVDANGQAHAISAVPIALEAEGDKISDEEKVAGGAVIGGIIGALTSKKKGKGALTGAAAGAAAGGAVALATKGKQLDLPVGQQFSVELAAPVEAPVPASTAGK